jgi:hypothetical protein
MFSCVAPVFQFVFAGLWPIGFHSCLSTYALIVPCRREIHPRQVSNKTGVIVFRRVLVHLLPRAGLTASGVRVRLRLQISVPKNHFSTGVDSDQRKALRYNYTNHQIQRLQQSLRFRAVVFLFPSIDRSVSTLLRIHRTRSVPNERNTHTHLVLSTHVAIQPNWNAASTTTTKYNWYTSSGTILCHHRTPCGRVGCVHHDIHDGSGMLLWSVKKRDSECNRDNDTTKNPTSLLPCAICISYYLRFFQFHVNIYIYIYVRPIVYSMNCSPPMSVTMKMSGRWGPVIRRNFQSV